MSTYLPPNRGNNNPAMQYCFWNSYVSRSYQRRHPSATQIRVMITLDIKLT